MTGQWSILGQCGDFGRGKRTSSQWVFVLWQISNTRGSQLLLPSLDHIIGSYFFLKETYGGGVFLISWASLLEFWSPRSLKRGWGLLFGRPGSLVELCCRPSPCPSVVQHSLLGQ